MACGLSGVALVAAHPSAKGGSSRWLISVYTFNLEREGRSINERGSFFIMALFVVGIAAALSAATLTRGVMERRAALVTVALSKAFHLAEAGLDDAMQRLRVDPTYTGTTSSTLANDSGGYTLDVQTVQDQPSVRVVRSTGFCPSDGPTLAGSTTRTVEAVVEIRKAAGPGSGIVGDRSVQFDGLGNGTDGMTIDSRIRTNDKAARAVSLIGRVTVMGDVILGPGSEPEEVLWMTPRTWPSIRGSVIVATKTLPLEPVELPVLSDRGNLRISGQEVVTLPGGLYRFHDIRITGQGQLVFTGPAQVYVEQNLEIAGNGIRTTTNLPSDLAFYTTGQHVSISEDANLSAKLNAPYAAVDISTRGTIYGMVTGQDVVIRGPSHIRYDETLNIYDEALNPPGENDPVQIHLLSWREGGL